MFGHLVFLLVFRSMDGAGAGFRGVELSDLFFADAAMVVSVIALVLSHGYSLVTNWFGAGEHERTSIQAVMLRPYGRIVVMHIAIIAGGFFFIVAGLPGATLVVLVALKIGLDLKLHARERQRLQSEPGPRGGLWQVPPGGEGDAG